MSILWVFWERICGVIKCQTTDFRGRAYFSFIKVLFQFPGKVNFCGISYYDVKPKSNKTLKRTKNPSLIVSISEFGFWLYHLLVGDFRKFLECSVDVSKLVKNFCKSSSETTDDIYQIARSQMLQGITVCSFFYDYVLSWGWSCFIYFFGGSKFWMQFI